MKNPFVQSVGGVLSADIAVPDHESEVEFYAKILTAGDAPLWRDDLMNNLGKPIIGLGARTPECDELPLQWMPHIQVADVAASAACATDMGGTELMHGKDEDGQGQWAVLIDPDGAAFGIIPVAPSDSNAPQRDERQGCISWLSLVVPNASSSRDFYQKVIGWNAKSIDLKENHGLVATFAMQIYDEISVAEICQFRSEQDVVPSVWLIHLLVDDLVESLRLVSQGGGKVIKEIAEARKAIIRDPVGVFFALQTS